MSQFLDPKYASFEEYTPGEQPKNFVYTKLNTNESPYPPGPAVIKAVSDPDLISRLRLYSDPTMSRLKKALADRYDVSPENVFVSNGSDEILNFAFMAFGQDGVLFPEISYGFYEVFGDVNQREYQKVPLMDNFDVRVSDYFASGKMVVLANPNAPTGKAVSREDVARICERNKDHVVLIDEAYVDFGAESCVSLISRYENLLVVHTYSKSRSLAGARLGFSFASETLTKDLEKIKFSTNPYNVNSLTAEAGIAALSEDSYYQENAEKIKKTRAWTEKELRSLGFEVVPSLSNFLFVRSDLISGEELYRTLKSKRVLVRHFDSPKISDYNRITIGTPEQMELLMQKIREILEEKNA